MPEIVKNYTTGNSRYQAAQTFTPTGVVLHSIGTPQPDASVLWKYWQNNGSAYVTHYVLDDHQIIQCMPDNFKCWHVGSPGNAKWIGVEMCEPKQIKYTSGATFTVSDLASAQKFVKDCYDNAVWLLAYLCKKYGWNPETAILTHGEVSKRGLSNTNHIDPEHLWNGLGMGYSLYQLRKDVAAAMGGTASAPAPSAPASTTTSGSATVKEWQLAAIADGFSFPKYGADGLWGAECVSVASKAIVKKRPTYTYKNLTRIVQRSVGVTVDGLCGPNTSSAIMAYQKKNGLTVDGCVGLNTWKMILGIK